MRLRGVIRSSWPSRVKSAGLSFTVTALTSSCCRSRSKLDRVCVALAVIRLTPSSRSVAGS
jgi:hypothetical protein